MAILAISRGTYNRAEALAQRVAERLGYPRATREQVVAAAATRYRIPVEELTAAMERRPSFWDRTLGAHVAFLPAMRAALANHVRHDDLVYSGYAGHFLLPDVSHVVSVREAAIWSAVWVLVSLLFNALVGWRLGRDAAGAFLTGYVIEKSLSVDNLFVFYMLFAAFRVPDVHQHKLLFWGIIGALILRTGMVFGGSWLLSRFTFLTYIFGGLLILTGAKMLARPGKEPHPEQGRVYRLLQKIIPTTSEPQGGSFVVRQDGRLLATPLLIALILIELSDVVFAMDSILAIFAITADPFLVFTSNVFAILGLRSLYFALAGMIDKFRYLRSPWRSCWPWSGSKCSPPTGSRRGWGRDSTSTCWAWSP
jgi:TerC family integral membrane protein